MANPTTNYGFVLPTSTDLVTDLPADFDVALQGVDTRLKALQPGTTLGDIAYSSATANTNTRLGIGSTGQVLTVTGGVPAWATAATSTFVGCRLTKSGNQSIANSTTTATTFDTEEYDTNGFHDNVTNNTRITIPSGQGGYYLVYGQIGWLSLNATGRREYKLLKNGSLFTEGGTGPTSGAYVGNNFTLVMSLIATDYIELGGFQTTGGNFDIASTGNNGTNFGVVKLG